MKNLTVAGRSNILAGLAKALGTKKADGSSRMCLSQIPVGLLEYAASFFSSDSFDFMRMHAHTCHGNNYESDQRQD